MTPSPSPSPDVGVFARHFLETYTPAPNDPQFAIDLVHALAKHQPLTLLQKWFLFAITLPGPFSWKANLFTYLSTVTLTQTLLVIAGIIGVFLLIHLLRVLLRNQFAKRNPPVFLELTFPSTTNKSAHATEQFFSLLHSLAGQRSFIERLVGYIKRYSLEIVATREHGIRYILVTSQIDAPIVQRNLLSYLPGIKTQQVTDYLEINQVTSNSLQTHVIELVQKGDFVLPLHSQRALAEHDPIAYLTGNMTKLQPGELLAFQVVTTPVTNSNHGHIVNRLQKLSNNMYLKEPLAGEVFAGPIRRALSPFLNVLVWFVKAAAALVDIIFSIVIPSWNWEPTVKTPPEQNISNPIEEQLRTEIKGKIDQPLFESSLRLLVQSADPSAYRERIAGFLTTFAPLGTTYQSLGRKTGLVLIDLRSRLTRFQERRLSWLANPILSPVELTDIYHFPYTDTTKTEDLLKIKSPALPAPLSFKQDVSKFDNVFAMNSYGGSDTPIGLTLEERRRHTYVLGATGSGKTTLLSTMIYQDILNGKGVAVIDPHGQLVEQLLRVIPQERLKDVVWFAPDDDAYPVAVNLMELPHNDTSLTVSQLEKQKSLVSSSLISIFQKFYDAKFFGPRMEYVLRNAILTALETPRPTLVTILDLLTDNAYRKTVLRDLTNPVLKKFWLNEFEKLGQLQRNAVVSPITNKIGGLLASPINYAILSQAKSTINFENVINGGKILLCDLSKGKIGEDASSFFGSLVLTKLQLAALARARMPEDERKDFYLYVDEFQNFATPAFAELVSEARKYRLATILAHQSISQVENRDLVKVILANVGTVICFRTANPEDERFILPIFTPEVAKHEISNLSLYTFYMKVSVGAAEDTFMAMVNNFTVEGSNENAQAAMEASRKQYANPLKPSLQEIQPLELLPEPAIISHKPPTSIV